MIKKRKKRTKKARTVTIPATGETFVLPTATASNTYVPGEIVWYEGSPKSFVQTTVDYVKRWFK